MLCVVLRALIISLYQLENKEGNKILTDSFIFRTACTFPSRNTGGLTRRLLFCARTRRGAGVYLPAALRFYVTRPNSRQIIHSLTYHNQDLPSDEILTCEVEIESELDIIREKLDSLDDLTSQTSSRASSLKALNRIQSLAHHLFHRLSRLDSDNDDSIASQLEALQERLDKFLVKLDNIMHHFKSSLTQVPPEENSRVHAASERTGNASHDSGAAVHKLNIRFNGKTCVKAFLQRLEELCLSRGVTDGKLFNSAAELFTDEALCWYRGVQSEVHSWLGLKTLLLDEYLPSDYDHRLLRDRSRTQVPMKAYELS
ncbi:hypothetical protein evm_002219 [Chilo suppressalis]|nr:hypothetical protein evm_002219 [Chilo suppressalis]